MPENQTFQHLRVGLLLLTETVPRGIEPLFPP